MVVVVKIVELQPHTKQTDKSLLRQKLVRQIRKTWVLQTSPCAD